MAGDEKAKDRKELATLLGDARKGKKRRFAILVKGTTICDVILAKKGLGAGVVATAKKEAKAKAVIDGIVTGKGTDLTFYSTDKFGIKTAVLKSWLKDEVGVTVKPEFQTVADLKQIGMTEEEEEEAKAKEKAPPRPTKEAPATPKDAAKAEKAKAEQAKKDDKTKKDAEKKAADLKKKLSAMLAGLVKSRGDKFREDKAAAKVLKATKETLDKGDLAKAEKAIRALEAATKP